jgi:hypothetical protein
VFGKDDDLLGDRLTGGVNDPVSALERHKSHLESDAHQTNGLGIETVTVQVGPDRHGSKNLVRTFCL